MKRIWNFIKNPTLWITLAILALLSELLAIVSLMSLSLSLRVMEMFMRYPQLQPFLKPFTDQFRQA